MEEKVKVSILCITFCQDKYIAECLDGLINQNTTFKYEILVHDDASTDDTKKIIKEYAQKHPNLIVPFYETENQFSKGVDIINELLIPNAKGEYIAFCEGDDFWCDENKLQSQVSIIENNDCSACISKVLGVTKEGKLTGGHFPRAEINEGVLNSNQFISYILDTRTLDFQQFQISGLTVRKTVLDQYVTEKPLFFEISKVGDFPMFLYLGISGNVYYYDKVQSCYRTAADGSWNSRNNNKNRRIEHYEREIHVVKEFDEYTNHKYHDDAEISILRREFKILRLNHDLKGMKQMKQCYSMLNLSQKIEEYILHYCPKSESKVEHIKLYVKGLRIKRKKGRNYEVEKC